MYDKVDADHQELRWPSVTAVLTDITDASRSASPGGYWQPDVEDGALTWQL